MRQNITMTSGELIKHWTLQPLTKEMKDAANFSEPIFNKELLWKLFLFYFKELYHKELIQDPIFIENVKPLFLYFLQDNHFRECSNLRGDISKPSFKKGLLVIGGYGVGKTCIFKVFEKIFQNYSPLRFKRVSSQELVNAYERCGTPLDKDQFFKEQNRRLLWIDDINAEREASNYGKINVVREVLYERYDKGLKTYATCNYANEERDVKNTLTSLGEKYGPRVFDRLFEMFNILEFKGESRR